MPKAGINRQDANRIVNAVKRTEASAAGSQTGSRWDTTPGVLVARITGDDGGSGTARKYAWEQVRQSASGSYVTVTDGATGTTTTNYATSPNGDISSGTVVGLAKGGRAKSGGGYEVGWTIIGAPASSPASCNLGGSPNVVGAFSTSEAADTSGGVPNTDGLQETYVSRVLWSTTDGALYVYYRVRTFDSCGKLVSVSGETKVDAVTGISAICEGT